MENSVSQDYEVKSTSFTAFPLMSKRYKVQKGSGYFSILHLSLTLNMLYPRWREGLAVAFPRIFMLLPVAVELFSSAQALLGHVEGFGLQRHSGFIVLQVKQKLLFFAIVFFSGILKMFRSLWMIN